MPNLGFLNLKKKRTREGNPDPSSSSQPTSPVTPSTSKPFDNGAVPIAASLQSPAPQPIAQPAQALKPETTAVEAETQAMNPVAVHPPAYVPAHSTDAQNLPTISNLINPPQNDGSSQRDPSPYQTPADPRVAQTSSPGTDPSRSPTMQPPQPHHSGGDQVRVTKGKYSLGDFDILRTLGTGSFGRVHLVQSKHNQRFYAVKVLKKVQVVKMKQVEHTNDERKMLGEVKHPFLITLWGTFQDAKNLYMVMDFVEGGELFSLLRKSGVRQGHRTTVPQAVLIVGIAVPQSRGQVLRGGSRPCFGIPPLEKHHIPGLKAREPATRPARASQDY
jgi:protein kinase A